MARSRWQEIHRTIQSAIRRGEYQPGERLPTAQQLAAEWGVAQMTAYRALDELHRTGWVRRQRRHGTRVAPPAERSRGRVGLLFSYTDDYPQSDYLRGIRAALPPQQHLLFCDTRANPALEAEYLLQMEEEADGVICWPTCAPENTPIMRELLERGVPLVCIDRVPDEVEVDAVVLDNYGSSLEGLRFLTGLGHRRIAHLTDQNMAVSSIRERYDAYLAAMAENGERRPERWVRRFPVESTHDVDLLTQMVHDALFTLLNQDEKPTALFLLHDYFLTATLEACDRLGIRIGQDLDVLSFTAFPQVSLRATQVAHRITLPSREMGRQAVERLQRRLLAPRLPREILKVAGQLVPAERMKDEG